MDLIINNELKQLLPPLSQEEYKILEESLMCEGCRDPLIIWNDILIDGHNRYEICKNRNIFFNTKEIDADNIEDIKIWIIDNQKGRRNLTDGWKYELAQVRKEILEKQGKKTQGTRTDLLSTIDKRLEPHNTRNEIANELGWSTGKVAMADKVWKDAPFETKEQIKSGEITFNQAYQQLNKPHVSNNSGENEWYTPGYIIEAAKNTMGSIDLDPATSLKANETVKAEQIFTKEDNGLTQKWSGNIWMNPPYSQGLMSEFSDKLINELGNIDQACVLVNNATETNWFQNLLAECDYVCFLKGRVKYLDYTGTVANSPLQGQAILYFGGNIKEFFNNFYDLGICLTRKS